MVTVPAGTFDCACSRIEITSGPNAGVSNRQCVSKEFGVLISEEISTPGPTGEVIGFLHATGIN